MVAFAEMLECVTFLEEDEVILLVVLKVLFFCSLEKEFVSFTLSLVEFNHLGVNGDTNSHLVGL